MKQRLLTVREIAETLGVPKHRVHYALRRRGVVIPPTSRASQTLLFEADVVPVVRAILKALDAERCGGLRA